MTTWKEAFTEYRLDRTQAEYLKEIRDSVIRRVETPRVTSTGRALKIIKKISEYTLTLIKLKINHKKNKSDDVIRN